MLEKQMNKHNRQVNFELLRIISMCMVIVLHALGHGGVLEQYEFGTIGYWLFWLIELLCYVAVNIFVLITGYFMVTSQVKVSRLIKLMLQVETYSLFCLVVSKFVIYQEISFTEMFRGVFPLTSGTYWFVSAYAILIVLAPLINRLIHAMDRKIHLLAIVLLSMLYSATPSIAFWSKSILTDGVDFVWFIVLYFTAAYIRLYGYRWGRQSSLKWFAKYGIIIGGGYLSYVAFSYVTFSFWGEIRGESIFYAFNSLIIFPASICLFIAFFYLKVENTWITTKIVNFWSQGCFGVYLLTDHPLTRKWIWKVVNLPSLTNMGICPTIAGIAGITVIFFCGGCLFEIGREKIMLLLQYKRLLKTADIFFERLINSIYNLAGSIGTK